MDQTWVTADLHLGHESVAARRGFRDSAHHDKAIADMWCSLIDNTDTVWILGDLTSRKWHLNGTDPLTLLADLPGHKRLIHGPTDSSHPMYPSAMKVDTRRIVSDMFEWSGTSAMVKAQGVPLLFSHFPYQGDRGRSQHFQQWRLKDLGTTIVHGYTCSEKRYSLSTQGTPQINAGMDAWGMAPVHIEDILLTQSSRGQMP